MIARKDTSTDHGRAAHVGRTVLIGFFTVAPLWLTWLIFDFLFASSPAWAHRPVGRANI